MFISWPVNRITAGVIPLCNLAPMLIYIGCNYEGTACGTKALSTHIAYRELLEAVPHRRNTLLILGEPIAQMREHLTIEDVGGLFCRELRDPVVFRGIRTPRKNRLSFDEGLHIAEQVSNQRRFHAVPADLPR